MHKKRILTGDRPTGPLHIGHLVGSLQNRVKLQQDYETFIMLANVQALTDNFKTPEKVRENVFEVLLDYYAVGLDFENTKIFIQSEVSAIHEIFIYLANFTSIQKMSHNPTLKTELSQKDMDTSTPLGFFIYPVHQVADIICVKADLVPVGRDQAPMVEDTIEIVRKFNRTYATNALTEPKALFGTTVNLPGTDGKAKMSKSLNNCIYLSDSEEVLKAKITKMPTDPNRIHATDPGTVEGNLIFTYHDIFNPDLDEVIDLKNRYQKGTVGDSEVKTKLFLALNNLLTPIRNRRIEANSQKDMLLEIALENSKFVSEIARNTADAMKEVMKIKF